MASAFLRASAALLLASTSSLLACVDPEGAAPPPEPVGAAQQTVPAPCTKDLAGKGAIAEGWFGIRTDGSVWLPVLGGSSEKYNGFGTDNERLGDIDGESLYQCIVKTGGAVHCVGPNDHGQLGRGFTSAEETVPAPVLGLPHPATYVGQGIDTTCALLDDGSVWCWGANDHGQIGNGQAGVDVLMPTQVAALGTGVNELSVGYWHACARKGSTVSCWGHNLYGELGIGVPSTDPDNVPTPTAVAGSFTSISAGGFFTCGIGPGGALSCWGDNYWGQMGIAGDQTNRSSPTPVPNIGPVSKVDTAVHAACAVRTDGGLWCWGNEENGRLGQGGTDATARRAGAPVTGPLGVGGVQDLRLTEGAGCAFTTDGRTFCWGAGGFIDGQGMSAVPIEVDFCKLPTLDLVSPNIGPITGGNQVTVTGTELVQGAQVFFDEQEATSVTVSSPTSLVATAPNKGYGEIVDVILVLPGNKTARILDGYEFSDGPRVSQITPPMGSSAGGTMVTIGGSYFKTGATVTFDGVAATNINVVAINQITAVTPPHAGGPVGVTVTNPDGQTDTLDMGFVYVGDLSVTSIDPTSGAPGTRVALVGDGFDYTTTIQFGDAAGTDIVVMDAKNASVVAPAHDVGTVDVVVTREDGQSVTLPAAFRFTEGGPGTGGSGSGGEDGGSDGPGDGCYCRTQSSSTNDARGPLLVAALGLAIVLRRRRIVS